jgi:hypothetical protein
LQQKRDDRGDQAEHEGELGNADESAKVISGKVDPNNPASHVAQAAEVQPPKPFRSIEHNQAADPKMKTGAKIDSSKNIVKKM